MRTFKVNEKEYKLEYSFAAAEHKDTVQKMFNVMSGAYLIKVKSDSMVSTMIEGVSSMVADIPHIVKTAFYSGLLENNPLSEEEAATLMRQYMKENKLSYNKLFEDIKECMVDDGFFDLSGLKEMLEEMSKSVREAAQNVPQDQNK